MVSPVHKMKNARLYLILDAQVHGYDRLFEILKEALRAGVDIVQLRDKMGRDHDALRFSRRVLKYCRDAPTGRLYGARRVPFITNDRVDLAMAASADGVHLGQGDLGIASARKILGDKKIIGVSCQTLPQAVKAQRDGADYIGFGSVFKTLTKPDREPVDLRLLSRVIHKIRIPVFAIGGINLENIDKVFKVGVRRVAVTRAILLSRNVGQDTHKFLKALRG